MPTYAEVAALTDHGLSELLVSAWRSSPQNPRPENVSAEDCASGAVSDLSLAGWVRPASPTADESQISSTF